MKTKEVSALTARTQFGQIMDRAVGKQERFLVDRRGEPAVVIMNVDDYLNTIAPEDTVLREVRDHAKRAGLDNLTMEDIDAEIAAYRQEKRISGKEEK